MNDAISKHAITSRDQLGYALRLIFKDSPLTLQDDGRAICLRNGEVYAWCSLYPQRNKDQWSLYVSYVLVNRATVLFGEPRPLTANAHSDNPDHRTWHVEPSLQTLDLVKILMTPVPETPS